MVVLYRLSHTAENVCDPIEGHQVRIYKLTVSIISKLSKNIRSIDHRRYYLSIKNNPEMSELQE